MIGVLLWSPDSVEVSSLSSWCWHYSGLLQPPPPLKVSFSPQHGDCLCGPIALLVIETNLLNPSSAPHTQFPLVLWSPLHAAGCLFMLTVSGLPSWPQICCRGQSLNLGLLTGLLFPSQWLDCREAAPHTVCAVPGFKANHCAQGCMSQSMLCFILPQPL